jgi:ATP-dependent exoDNAse (exonuclease V) beta subunit
MRSQELFRQKSSDKQYLHVIKASAGSGKTHRLTGEYLRLLFSTPNAYKHILAVTFTNKATDEMKSRIIKELYSLSANEKSDYLTQLCEDFHLSETKVRENATHILKTILHDYSAFAISTIDKFFQQTMRAFTREMGLSGGYNVEVDDTAYLPEVIDTMLFELDKTENKELSQWLLAFMTDKIENNKGWSTKKDVQELATQIFNEKYKTLSQSDKDNIHDKKHLTDYKRTLTKIVRDFESELKSIGEKAVNIMKRFDLQYDDFPYKKASGFSSFVKWANGATDEPGIRFLGMEDDVSKWYGKDTPTAKRSSMEAAFSELNTQIKSAIAHFENSTFYHSANNILKYFYTLGILNDVQRRLQQLQQDENIIFLSDTTELLNKIIADSDSPFIYEKTGTFLKNYMIDEFQDTSLMQWNNFRPLMCESLANNNFNLIVGDVKQSIYRWRNSDWRLLEEHIPVDFQSDTIQQHSLDTNWRSDANIVHFNNALFELTSQILQADFVKEMQFVADEHFEQYASTKIKEVYSQAYQHVPTKKSGNDGKVDIIFLRSEKEDDWKTEALERLPKQIEQLQDEGFRLKDIAIIVRRNHEAVAVAETLLKYKEENPNSPYRYDIISNEALIIGNAQSVKSVIALLRWFRNRSDDTKKMLAVYEFYRFHRKISPDAALQSFLGKNRINFPDDIDAQLNNISYLPFYEMIEAFFALSKDVLDEKENAYVQAFLDIVLRFNTNASSDIDNFLNWWDEKGYKKTLFSPDNQDAIRLVTIHKSKGLGFGVVIMPFADWEIDHQPAHSNIIWCCPNKEPFNMLNIVPLRYGKNLINTIFRKDYLEEKLFTYIDNLNLLYVAFTRAKHRIIAFTPQPKANEKKQDGIKNISELLWISICQSIFLLNNSDSKYITLDTHLHKTDSETFFSLGSTEKFTQKEVLSAQSQPKTTQWQSIPFDNRLKLRFNSIGYFKNNGKRNYGMLMHDIISRVETIGDIPQAVERKILSGELNSNEKENIVHELTGFLSIPEVSDWYSGKYTVLNEMQVLHPRFGFSRPDRVMLHGKKAVVVDYKFGETEDKKYNRQVQHYLERIKEMGYSDVQGFVFYVRKQTVSKVY